MQSLNLQGGEKNSIIMWKNDSCYCIHYLEIYGLPGRRCVSEEVLYCLQNQSISLKDTSPDGRQIYGTIHIRSVS